MNKAYLFDNDIKTERQLSLPKIITILVEFGHRMEGILMEMRKLVARPQSELIRAPLPSLNATPQKDRPLVELKTPLPQCPGKELIAKILKIEVPAAPTSSTKMTKRELETPKTTSSEPAPWRSNKKKKKEPTPDLESVEEEAKSSEEEEVENSSKEPESEEEGKPSTPALEKKK